MCLKTKKSQPLVNGDAKLIKISNGKFINIGYIVYITLIQDIEEYEAVEVLTISGEKFKLYGDVAKELLAILKDACETTELCVLLKYHSDYSFGSHFMGIFNSKKEAAKAVDHLGRRDKEDIWYQVTPLKLNKVWS